MKAPNRPRRRSRPRSYCLICWKLGVLLAALRLVYVIPSDMCFSSIWAGPCCVNYLIEASAVFDCSSELILWYSLCFSRPTCAPLMFNLQGSGVALSGGRKGALSISPTFNLQPQLTLSSFQSNPLHLTIDYDSVIALPASTTTQTLHNWQSAHTHSHSALIDTRAIYGPTFTPSPAIRMASGPAFNYNNPTSKRKRDAFDSDYNSHLSSSQSSASIASLHGPKPRERATNYSGSLSPRRVVAGEFEALTLRAGRAERQTCCQSQGPSATLAPAPWRGTSSRNVNEDHFDKDVPVQSIERDDVPIEVHVKPKRNDKSKPLDERDESSSKVPVKMEPKDGTEASKNPYTPRKKKLPASPRKKLESMNSPGKRKRCLSPPLAGADVEDPLTWHDYEITGHDPTDPSDDGYGINGIGFKPTAAMAWERSQKRQQQLAELKTRESREARKKRKEKRDGAEADEESSPKEKGVIQKKVKFDV